MTEQAEVINVIEENTQITDTQLHEGKTQIDVAIINAEGARRKKWICLFITIIIIAILAIIITKVVSEFSCHGALFLVPFCKCNLTRFLLSASFYLLPFLFRPTFGNTMRLQEEILHPFLFPFFSSLIHGPTTISFLTYTHT